MRHVVFVAPLMRDATLRFIRAIARLDGIVLSLISSNGADHLPPDLKEHVQSVAKIGNAMDPGQIALAAKSLMRENGPIHRLFGALEELQVPIAKARDFLNIEGMRTQAAINFREKAQMKTVFRQHGIPCAHHCLVKDAKDAYDFAEKVGFPLVVKPPAGAGAKNTFTVETMERLKDYMEVYQPSASNPVLLEEFIQGDEHTFEGISINGELQWHSLCRYYPTPLEVLKNPWIKWCVLLPRELDHEKWHEIRQLNRKALKCLGLGTGLTHMEWFRRHKDGSIAISEVGARPPGAQIMTLMSYAHDKNFYHAWAELMVFDRFEAPERRYAAGAAFLRGIGQGRVKAIHGIEKARQEVGSLVMEAKLPQIGQPSSPSYEGEGYVLVRHPDTEIVKQALHKLISTIQIEYA